MSGSDLRFNPEHTVNSELPVQSKQMSNAKRTGGAAVLAAGRSERFGSENKPLATVDGRSVVRAAAETILAAPPDDVVVVGYDAAAVREILPKEFDSQHNGRYAAGQHGSVHAGVAVAQ